LWNDQILHSPENMSLNDQFLKFMLSCGICRLNVFIFQSRSTQLENKSRFVTYWLISFLSIFIEQHHRILIRRGWWVKALHLWAPISEVSPIPCGKPLFRFHGFSTSSTKCTLLEPAIRFYQRQKTENDYPVFNLQYEEINTVKKLS